MSDNASSLNSDQVYWTRGFNKRAHRFSLARRVVRRKWSLALFKFDGFYYTYWCNKHGFFHFIYSVVTDQIFFDRFLSYLSNQYRPRWNQHCVAFHLDLHCWQKIRVKWYAGLKSVVENAKIYTLLDGGITNITTFKHYPNASNQPVLHRVEWQWLLVHRHLMTQEHTHFMLFPARFLHVHGCQ